MLCYLIDVIYFVQIPACANEELLQNILRYLMIFVHPHCFYQYKIRRDEWEWDGYVCSDCGATPQIYSTQHFAINYIEAAQV